MKTEEYEILVLDSGAGGKFIGWTFAKKGMKTAVIERKYVGGSCPNIACLPSKNIIHSAKVASYFRRSGEFGISKQNWKIDMPGVREWKRKMVTGLVDMHLDLYHKSGAELIMGSGRFVAPKTAEVTYGFHIVRDNILGGNRVTAARYVPFCLFTDPEFARIGLSETEAKERGIPCRIAKLPLTGYCGLEHCPKHEVL